MTERLAQLRKAARLLKPETRGTAQERHDAMLRTFYEWKDLRDKANETFQSHKP